MTNCIRFSLVPILAITLVLASSTLYAQPVQLGGAASGELQRIQFGASARQFSADQMNRQVLNRDVPWVGVRGVNMRNFMQESRNQGPAASKPFSGLDRGPAVTPYLSLANPFNTVGGDEFFTQIRPQREQAQQRQRSQQTARQQAVQQRRLSQAAAMGPYNITGSEQFAPTGHGATFMQMGAFQNTGGYFAPMSRPKSAR